MRARGHFFAPGIIIAFALALLVGPLARDAQADVLEKARMHYKRGAELYKAGKYRPAIRQFKQADKLSPAPLLSYNIALCHDQLGESDKALVRYKAYLEAMPSAANRPQVEKSIARIEAANAARLAAASTAQEAEDAAAKAAADEKAAEDATASGATGEPVPDAVAGQAGPTGGEDVPPVSPEPPAVSVDYGDEGLNRVAAINVGEVRDERATAMAANLPPPGQGPPPTAGGLPPVGDGGQPKKSKPFYKKWWVWALVGAGVLTVVLIASSGDDGGSSPQRVRGLVPQTSMGSMSSQEQGVLLRF